MQDQTYGDIECREVEESHAGITAFAAVSFEPASRSHCLFGLFRNVERGHAVLADTSLGRAPNVQEHSLQLLRQVRAEIRDAIGDPLSLSREVFKPSQLLTILREEVDLYVRAEAASRTRRLLALTGLLYVAVELHYCDWHIDVEIDVHIARLSRDHVYGGPDQDDRLTINDWHDQMQRRIGQLELHAPPCQSYIHYLVAFAALTHAALECDFRHAQFAEI